MENVVLQELKVHFVSGSAWLRIIFMLLFAIIGSVVRGVVLAVLVLQALFVLFGGRPNPRLLLFGKQLANYAYYIWLYLTYNQEQKPFPFGDWPSSDAVVAEGVEPWQPPEVAVPEPESEPEIAVVDEPAVADAPPEPLDKTTAEDADFEEKPPKA
ncbi:MAG: DUF4389 domain-containing protein [Gammaproteobacteria bacterium]|nr:DUF4389 domain-containing protein [Gammaproteobacteria bacterium]